MFLFNGVASKDPKSPLYNETFNILHTGDFRFKNSMLKHFVQPATAEEVKESDDNKETPEKQTYMEIDYLYMDNTFATHAESFPSQDEAFETLFKLIEDKRKEHVENFQQSEESVKSARSKKSKPMNELKFNLYCYTLGKEEIFHSLAKNFDTKIMMLKDRVTKLDAIGMGSKHFVTRDEFNS